MSSQPTRSYLAIAAAIVIAGVLVSASLFFAVGGGTKTTTITATTDLSQQSSSSGYPPVVYQVIRTSLTLRGEAAVLPCTGFNEADCPSPTNATLSPVDLITYGGSYYYLYNQTEATSSSAATTYMTWFTNSSVVCISPAHPITNTEHQNPTCPAGPFQPTVVTIPIGSTSASNSSIGLRLDLNLSSQSPGAITVAVDLANTFDHVNNLTTDGRWSYDSGNYYLWEQGGCGSPTDVPFGYAIFQGNLSANEIATSVPLTLEAQLGGVFCLYVAPTPFFAFYPLSDVALTYQWGNLPTLAGVYNVTASTTCIPAPSWDCWWNGLATWSGYWTGSTQPAGPGQPFGGACPSGEQSSSTGVSTSYSSSTDCPLALNQFTPGVYTVVAADEWGQVAMLYFTVTS